MNNPKLKKIIAIVIGVILSVVMLVVGFRIFSTVFTRASDIEPREVVVSEIDANSAKISWATGVETQGVIEYGTSPTALNFFAPESSNTKDHQQELTLLSPNTTYYFQIRIGDKKYDNGGVPWTFTTRVTQQTGESTSSPTPTEPVATPTTSDNQPTPIQEVEVPATDEIQGCNETDCAKVKEMIGKGCTSRDYILCIKKITPTTSL